MLKKKKNALSEIATFQLLNADRGHQHVDAEALTAYFMHALNAGASEEDIIEATKTAILASPSKFNFTKNARLERMERMQAALRDAVHHCEPIVARRHGHELFLSQGLKRELLKLANQKFCPKSSLHHGLERLSHSCKEVLVRIKPGIKGPENHQ